MAGIPSPLIGFNNHLRYRGHRFHLQTEDSGVQRPHCLTHLFADGGHVVQSARSDYAQYVDHPERVRLVREMMKKQHLAVAKDLQDGCFDEKLSYLFDKAEPPSGPGVAEARQASRPQPPPQATAPSPPPRNERVGGRAAPGAPLGKPQAPHEPTAADRLPSWSAQLEERLGAPFFEESLDDVILYYLTSDSEPAPWE